jgi:hypothetical protein
MFICCHSIQVLAVSLYVFMLAAGGTVTREPVALSRLVLGTEGHCVGSHSLLLVYLHWRQTVMRMFKQLMKWNCDT